MTINFVRNNSKKPPKKQNKKTKKQTNWNIISTNQVTVVIGIISISRLFAQFENINNQCFQTVIVWENSTKTNFLNDSEYHYVMTSRPITYIYNVKYKYYIVKYKMYRNEHSMHDCNVFHIIPPANYQKSILQIRIQYPRIPNLQ